MCNPVWTLVRTPSVLGVEIELDGDAGITGSVVTRVGSGPPTKRIVGAGDFPLELPVEAGTTHVVSVRAVSLGVEGNLTVTARVDGSDERGPDACRLEVDDSHPVAIDTIIVVAE
ncbi:MAG TPA: hypothetical protein VFQ76_04055 [Longimicrobiaceae bacterium]|nr:hypothetical protein [Longimicrobiaceae bacterium]